MLQRTMVVIVLVFPGMVIVTLCWQELKLVLLLLLLDLS